MSIYTRCRHLPGTVGQSATRSARRSQGELTLTYRQKVNRNNNIYILGKLILETHKTLSIIKSSVVSHDRHMILTALICLITVTAQLWKTTILDMGRFN